MEAADGNWQGISVDLWRYVRNVSRRRIADARKYAVVGALLELGANKKAGTPTTVGVPFGQPPTYLVLFQRSADGYKKRIDRSAEPLDCSNDHHRDAYGNHRVFDRGGAALIAEKTHYRAHVTWFLVVLGMTGILHGRGPRLDALSHEQLLRRSLIEEASLGEGNYKLDDEADVYADETVGDGSSRGMFSRE